MTGNAWIRAALVKLGALDPTDTLDADTAQSALDTGNDWIDSLALQDFSVYYLLRTVVPLSASTPSYTIGTGGTINIVRPVDIDHANLVISTTPTNTETPISVFTDQEWELIPQKAATSSYPQGIYYDHGWIAGLARISPYPIPTQTVSIVLYTPQALVEMASGVDVTFPPGYRKFLTYGLARELSASGFTGWDGEKEAIYQAVRSDVFAKNERIRELLIDPMFAGSAGRANIYTGTVAGRVM